jgi:hypothetical protein
MTIALALTGRAVHVLLTAGLMDHEVATMLQSAALASLLELVLDARARLRTIEQTRLALTLQVVPLGTKLPEPRPERPN